MRQVLGKLEQILSLTCANSETLLPSVQIGLLGSIMALLQNDRLTSGTGMLGFAMIRSLHW